MIFLIFLDASDISCGNCGWEKWKIFHEWFGCKKNIEKLYRKNIWITFERFNEKENNGVSWLFDWFSCHKLCDHKFSKILFPK